MRLSAELNSEENQLARYSNARQLSIASFHEITSQNKVGPHSPVTLYRLVGVGNTRESALAELKAICIGHGLSKIQQVDDQLLRGGGGGAKNEKLPSYVCGTIAIHDGRNTTTIKFNPVIFEENGGRQYAVLYHPAISMV